AADLAALPYSHFDAASGVGGYALHFGLPMVVSDAGSLPDLVTDRESCVARPGDEEELRVKMERILMDNALRARLERETSVKREEFGWDSIAHTTMEVYRQVMAQ
ncbi:MAG: glycosyltransferase, partial [Nitrospirae bacterium]|nr:glycosyltransferase [Nitrospirota bacterium]